MPKLSLTQPHHSKNISLGEATTRGLLSSSSPFKAVLFPWFTVSQSELDSAYRLLRDTHQLDGVQLGRSGFIFTREAADQIAPKLLSFDVAVGENILLLAEYLNLRLRLVIPDASIGDPGKISVGPRSLSGMTTWRCQFLGSRFRGNDKEIKYIAERLQLWFYDAAYNLSEFFKRLEWLLTNKKPKRRKNILIFSWRDIKHPQAGGAEVYLHKVSEILRHNYNVTIFTSRPANLYLYDTIHGVNIIRRGGRLTVYLYAVIYYLFFLRQSTDLVIDVENGIPFFTPLFCRLPKILLVHHVHKGQWFKEFGLLGAVGYFLEVYLMPLVYRRAKIITVSPSSEQDLVALGFNPRRISLAYNGVGRSLHRHCHKTAEPSLLYLGRLKKYKRVEKCLEAVARLRRDFPKITLTIAGVGDDLEKLEARVKNLGLAKIVTFTGFVSEQEKWRLLEQAWLFLMPSSREGWGVAVIEAAQAGTPSVGFNVPGIRDAIIDGATGLLADTDEEFYRHIRHLLKDGALRQEMSLAAGQRAQSLSWKTTAETIEAAVINEQFASLLKNKYPLGKAHPYELVLASPAKI